MRILHETRPRRARYTIVALLALALASAALLPGAVTANSESATPTSPQVALDWNSNAVDAVRAAKTMDGVATGSPARAFYQSEGLLYMSYVQAAVYDATMKISRRYELYHDFRAKAGNASLEAAVIAATYNTLVFYLGDAGGVLATKYTAAIAALPAGKKTARGIAVGEAAAKDIETLRANDGRNAPISDACPIPTTPPTPGAYLCTPSSIQSLQTPWLASMRPFILRNPSQFRAPAPPAVGSTRFAKDLAETKAFGAVDSAVRSSAQRDTAWFWNANVISQLNKTLRDVATQHTMDLVDTVRLLAMGEIVPTDAGIACFDSKYHYFWWRPVTAIQNDGNPADVGWTPLLPTPNHMEYPSQHGCVTHALFAVIASALGTRQFNVTAWGAQGGASTLTTPRAYSTLHDLDAELVNARVWMGFHYRTSVMVGERLGDKVVQWTLERAFQAGDDDGGGD